MFTFSATGYRNIDGKQRQVKLTRGEEDELTRIVELAEQCGWHFPRATNGAVCMRVGWRDDELRPWTDDSVAIRKIVSVSAAAAE